MSNNPCVHFILTGGTIDSYYDGIKDTVIPYIDSIIPQYIQSLKLYIDTEFEQICMKDSRDLTVDDMESIKQTIEKSPHKYFVITHGTYTMPDTARYLKENLKKDGAVVILTGSMTPLSINNSGAGFNLGFSIAQLFNLNSGIYVSMNGKIFDPAEVAKLISEGRFISIFSKR